MFASLTWFSTFIKVGWNYTKSLRVKLVGENNFNSTEKVYSVVDEAFLAGEIRETSQQKILKQLATLNSLE